MIMIAIILVTLDVAATVAVVWHAWGPLPPGEQDFPHVQLGIDRDHIPR